MIAESPRIVVVGSINMDLVIRCPRLPAPGETVLATAADEVPGGKGANQAVAAARAGGRVSFVGRIGSDAFAPRLLESLRKQGIDTAEVSVAENCSSGLAVVSVDDAGENSILVVPGANAKVDTADLKGAAETIAEADVLLVQLEIPVETVAEAIASARQRDVRVILDPAPITATLPPELFDVDLICPNQAEASAIVGRQLLSVDDARDAVPELHARGVRNVIITMGGHGAVVSDGATAEVIRPFPVRAVDTTAAGDAFAGALAVQWARRDCIFDAARFASAAGALAATRAGAQPGMPHREEVERLLAQTPS